MALIICPDCKKQISDRADRCPHCGLPAQYFHRQKAEQPAPAADNSNLDYANLGKCKDGYLIVKMNPKNGNVFYGCTNYFSDENKCGHMITLSSDPV